MKTILVSGATGFLRKHFLDQVNAQAGDLRLRVLRCGAREGIRLRLT